ncbi:hypothetical protein [Microbacterium sp.]|uniref:hypothetical protein n=1 Tax=Microbacterium sp. TaxID=51671 RepID=UPI0028528211|nr:hypothetical protein [Microbacterium sp.]
MNTSFNVTVTSPRSAMILAGVHAEQLADPIVRALQLVHDAPVRERREVRVRPGVIADLHLA